MKTEHRSANTSQTSFLRSLRSFAAISASVLFVDIPPFFLRLLRLFAAIQILRTAPIRPAADPC